MGVVVLCGNDTVANKHAAENDLLLQTESGTDCFVCFDLIYHREN